MAPRNADPPSISKRLKNRWVSSSKFQLGGSQVGDHLGGDPPPKFVEVGGTSAIDVKVHLFSHLSVFTDSPHQMNVR